MHRGFEALGDGHTGLQRPEHATCPSLARGAKELASQAAKHLTHCNRAQPPIWLLQRDEARARQVGRGDRRSGAGGQPIDDAGEALRQRRLITGDQGFQQMLDPEARRAGRSPLREGAQLLKNAGRSGGRWRVRAWEGGIIDGSAWRGMQAIELGACVDRWVGDTDVKECRRSLRPQTFTRVLLGPLGARSFSSVSRVGRRSRAAQPSGVAEKRSPFAALPAVQAGQRVPEDLSAMLAATTT